MIISSLQPHITHDAASESDRRPIGAVRAGQSVRLGFRDGAAAVLDAELTAEDAAAQLSSSFLSRSQMDGTFSEEAAATLGGLGIGEAAAVDYGATSLLIAMRLDPLETMTLDTLRATILSDMGAALVDADMAAAGEALTANLDQGAMNKLPASRIKMSV